MKKLLVLLTVLVFASTASATLTAVAPAEINVGDTAGIGIDVAGEQALLSGALVVAGDVSVDASGAAMVDVPGISDAPFIVDLSADPDMMAFLDSVGLGGATALYYEVIHLGVPAIDVPNGALVSGVTITGLQVGSASVNVVDFGTGEIVSTANVTVIPEPMTIALLGLGGLFLRRRK